jgi:hypothetical protein
MVTLTPEQQLFARECSFVAHLHNDMELWQRDAAQRPAVEARLRAAFEREHLVLAALAQCRPKLMQSMLGERLAPLQHCSAGLQAAAVSRRCCCSPCARPAHYCHGGCCLPHVI